MKRFISLCLLVAMILPLPVFALPAISCHCFQDRSFDPDRPAAADAYYLATAQNRLLADAFGQPRRDIVMAKQKGTGNDELWIAGWAAAASGQTPQALLRASEELGSWRPVLAQHRLDLPGQQPDSAGDTATLARQIVTATLVDQGLCNRATLTDLYAAGADPQEAILAVLLAAATGRPAQAIRQQVADEEKTWGALMAEAGLTEDLDGSLARLLASGKQKSRSSD
jgi:hypothetical protein